MSKFLDQGAGTQTAKELADEGKRRDERSANSINGVGVCLCIILSELVDKPLTTCQLC